MEQTGWELLLPEGVLDYFEVKSVNQPEDGYEIELEERPLKPDEFVDERLTSKGFVDAVTLGDFPIRGKAYFLKVKRRRWLNELTNQVVSRDWDLVANGTRMTKEFATFLKGLHRLNTGKLQKSW